VAFSLTVNDVIKCATTITNSTALLIDRPFNMKILLGLQMLY